MLTIRDLVSRYNMSTQQTYEQIRAAAILTIKRGNRSLFNEGMVAMLDENNYQTESASGFR